MKKFLVLLMIVMLFALSCTGPTVVYARAESNGPTIIDRINELLFNDKNAERLPKVFVGGVPLGLSLNPQGIRIVGISEVKTVEGKKCPAIDGGIEIGDILMKANGKELCDITELSEIVRAGKGTEIEIEYTRQGKTCKTKLKPQLDELSGQYKLGLWGRDGSNGIGTLTFVTKEGRFASLGHPVLNSENGEIYKINSENGGAVYPCIISGVNKGIKGKAGELRGTFEKKSEGKIHRNNYLGVYGKLNPSFFKSMNTMEIGGAGQVKTGRAHIYSTIEGKSPEKYEIEIVKTTNQSSPEDKGMVIKITDKKLLELTGGIVQGMSGSPIVQNNRLIGAVTHVFINDPSRGYACYAEWMLKTAETVDTVAASTIYEEEGVLAAYGS